jgi:hypothetical protein
VLLSSHISHSLHSEPKIRTHMLAILHTSPYDAYSLNAKEMVLELETSIGDPEPKVCFSFHLLTVFHHVLSLHDLHILSL